MKKNLTRSLLRWSTLAVFALPGLALAHGDDYAPGPEGGGGYRWEHREVHRDLNDAHAQAHWENPWMGPRQHRRLHRELRREHRAWHWDASWGGGHRHDRGCGHWNVPPPPPVY